MLRKIVEKFVINKSLANLVIIIFLVLGLPALYMIPYSFFPEAKDTRIRADFVVNGASPKEMEEGILNKVESKLRGVPGVKETNATAFEGFAYVDVECFYEYDIDEVLTEVKNIVDQINDLPGNAEKPKVYKQRFSGGVNVLSIQGDVDAFTLKAEARKIERELLLSGIVTQVQLQGFEDQEIVFEVSPENLEKYNLTLQEISEKISRFNRDISAGLVRSKIEELRIRSFNKSYTTSDISKTPIKQLASGRIVFLGDIAKFKEQFSENPGSLFNNGKRSGIIRVNKLNNEDLGKISNYVEKYVEEYNERSDKIKLFSLFSFFSMLKERLNMLLSNGFLGLILIFVLLGFFLNLRLSFWVAWGIPSSFLGMIFLLNVMGFTINMLSLFGMILVIGILVDDGIVIAESIYSHFEKGKSPTQAAVDGTMEVIAPILTSVTTTMIAFSPLLLLTSRFSFLSQMGFVVIASLGFSLFEAILVLPSHLGSKHVLKRESKVSKKRSRNPLKFIKKHLNRGLETLRDNYYARYLRFCVKNKSITLSALLGFIFLVCGFLYTGVIKATFFPTIPFDSFNINIEFAPGTNEEYVIERLSDIDEQVWAINDSLKQEENDTLDYIKYVLFYTQEFGGGVEVSFKDLDERNVEGHEIRERIRVAIGPMDDATEVNFSSSGAGNFGSPVSINLLSTNNTELSKARDLLVKELSSLEELKDVKDNINLGYREIVIELKSKAYLLNVDYFDVLSQVRNAFYGSLSQRLQIREDEVKLWVRLPKENRDALGELDKFKVRTGDGSFYPLHELATYKVQKGIGEIKHYNGLNSMTIEANTVSPEIIVPDVLKKVNEDILPRVLSKYPSVSYVQGGQAKNASESQKELLIFSLTALFIMFVLVVFHFKSFTQAIIVFIMIPISWLGSSLGHSIEGMPVSILSVWGFLALSGIIINDSVVLMDRYNKLLLEGKEIKAAISLAASSRFRAIVLTSLTTVFGLYPLIFEKSFQAQFLIPMAVSIAYGVLFGTIFILLFVPPLVLAINQIKYGIHCAFTPKEKQKSREMLEKSIKIKTIQEEYEGTK